MAENYDVSRNAAFKQLKITKEKLEEFESNLKLLEKKKKLEKIYDSISDEKIKSQLEELM